MIEYNHLTNSLKIIIPNSGMLELARFRRSILDLLSKLEVNNCDPDSKENLKAVYELLSHLEPEANTSKSAPFKEFDQTHLKN